MDAGVAKPQSSLPLQIFIYFDGYWSALYFAIEVLLFTYKGVVLRYPPSTWPGEFTMVVLFAVFQKIRLYLGTAGNKTEQLGGILWFVLLTIPVVLILMYLLEFQVYVLRFEVFLAITGICFVGVEFFLALIAACFFTRRAV
ncbi:unnamed protein product [Vitrella brassicaformis CCMP3155]|uniref:Transmembrane protein 216 n=2 Tax=Vitrella brassicaformis TaxID=1169539 RepID=A0A0G4GF07_VITBC|nr:unnamed protein product [Vitrella brassicaformis CCMP3155]|eukprot:CEM28092.1 unnamed protein product [Vitrella brassicaformis CCMP3155]